jgi:glycosyltransferase involved in cell wall biosynthesis
LTTSGKLTVHILLASYQGEAYLAQQLESIAAQTYSAWQLWVSDDGSTDTTREIVAQFASQVTQTVVILDGPCKGVTQNFFHLVNTVSLDNSNSLYAFCDQDDVWLPEKVARAVAQYQSQILSDEQPFLYCGRTEIVDANLRHLGYSAIPTRPLGFGNALLQNIAGGNTMVFNSALLQTLRHINPLHSVWHDWSAYLVATGCGGILYFDKEASVLYRQHKLNAVGAKDTLFGQLKKLKYFLCGSHKLRGDQHVQSIEDFAEYLTIQSMQQFAFFNKARYSSIFRKWLLINKANLWHQDIRKQILLLSGLVVGLI